MRAIPKCQMKIIRMGDSIQNKWVNCLKKRTKVNLSLKMAFIYILQEGKDKQFLLAKIADLTGESKKKAPKLTTVNENKKHIEVTILS